MHTVLHRSVSIPPFSLAYTQHGVDSAGMRMTNQGRTFPVSIPTIDELDRLMRACSRRAPSGLRDRALLAVLAFAGLRVGEAVQLRISDLNLTDGYVQVRRGKGGRSRRVSLAPGACAIVQQWLQVRSKLNLPATAPVFCTITKNLQGHPLATANIRQMVRRRARRAGIEGRVHPHALRHWCATSMARNRVPLHVVSMQLGHSSLAVTSHYLRNVEPHETQAAVATLPMVSLD